MDEEVVKHLFTRINVWKRGDERAPHKPLLLLLALAKCRNNQRYVSFAEVDKELTDLLVDFGPSRRSYHPEYPFWRLQNDGIWQLQSADGISKTTIEDISKGELLKCNVLGGFTQEIYDFIHSNPKLLHQIAQDLLEKNFPASIHEDILSAVGLEYEVENVERNKRDPNFRKRILVSYEYQCSVCNFSVRLGSTLLALEAAHIKWHQAGGPDVETNGLALCSIHHKLFDRGAFTLSDSLVIEVSEQANGASGCQEWLISFHGKPIKKPQNPDNSPKMSFLAWHRREVFRGPSRYLAY